MDDVQKLKQQLADAEEARKQHNAKEDYLKLKEAYNNTAWANKKLASTKHAAKGVDMDMVKFSNFREAPDRYDGKPTYLVTKTSIHLVSRNTGYFNYNKDTHTTDVKNCFGSYTFGLFDKKNKISIENFDAAYLKAEAAADLFYTEFRDGLRSTEYITMGDHTKQSNESSLLVDSGIALINLKEYPDKMGTNLNIFELLTYNNHPLVVGDYLINSTKSKEIILTIAKNMYNNAASWGSSIAQRDFPRVDALRAFVKLIKWNE